MVDTAVHKKTSRFFSNFPEFEFKKGEIIISPSAKLEYIYYLESGAVKMVGNSEEGDEIVLHLFRQQSFFPMMLLLSSSENAYTFIAFEEVKVRKAPITDVLMFVKSNPDVMLDLTTRFSSAIAVLLLKIEGMAFHSAFVKVVALFVYLVQKFGDDTELGQQIRLQLTHEDIAAWIGMRRETVSRQVEKLEKDGLIIVRDRHYIVPSLELLKQKLEKLPEM